MSQPPPLAYDSTRNQTPPTNTLGLVGFIFVMLGFVGFCVPPAFFLGLVGTVLCGIAVFNRPRGLAIAGLVVGSIQVLFALIVVLLLGVLLASGARTAAQSVQIQTGLRHADAIALAVDQYQRQHNALPKTLADLPPLGEDAADGFGRPIRYVPNFSAGTYQLKGDSWDEKPDTADDVTFKDTSIKPYSAATIPTMAPARKPATVPAFPAEPVDPN